MKEQLHKKSAQMGIISAGSLLSDLQSDPTYIVKTETSY